MNFGLRNARKRNLTLVGAMAFMTVCFMVFQSTSAYAKTAKEIDVSVDVALENFNKTVKGGNEFLKSAKGVLVFPSVFKAGVGVGANLEKGPYESAARLQITTAPPQHPLVFSSAHRRKP